MGIILHVMVSPDISQVMRPIIAAIGIIMPGIIPGIMPIMCGIICDIMCGIMPIIPAIMGLGIIPAIIGLGIMPIMFGIIMLGIIPPIMGILAAALMRSLPFPAAARADIHTGPHFMATLLRRQPPHCNTRSREEIGFIQGIAGAANKLRAVSALFAASPLSRRQAPQPASAFSTSPAR
jgi:hypothetical protein